MTIPAFTAEGHSAPDGMDLRRSNQQASLRN